MTKKYALTAPDRQDFPFVSFFECSGLSPRSIYIDPATISASFTSTDKKSVINGHDGK